MTSYYFFDVLKSTMDEARSKVLAGAEDGIYAFGDVILFVIGWYYNSYFRLKAASVSLEKPGNCKYKKNECEEQKQNTEKYA